MLSPAHKTHRNIMDDISWQAAVTAPEQAVDVEFGSESEEMDMEIVQFLLCDASADDCRYQTQEGLDAAHVSAVAAKVDATSRACARGFDRGASFDYSNASTFSGPHQQQYSDQQQDSDYSSSVHGQSLWATAAATAGGAAAAAAAGTHYHALHDLDACLAGANAAAIASFVSPASLSFGLPDLRILPECTESALINVRNPALPDSASDGMFSLLNSNDFLRSLQDEYRTCWQYKQQQQRLQHHQQQAQQQQQFHQLVPCLAAAVRGDRHQWPPQATQQQQQEQQHAVLAESNQRAASYSSCHDSWSSHASCLVPPAAGFTDFASDLANLTLRMAAQQQQQQQQQYQQARQQHSHHHQGGGQWLGSQPTQVWTSAPLHGQPACGDDVMLCPLLSPNLSTFGRYADGDEDVHALPSGRHAAASLQQALQVEEDRSQTSSNAGLMVLLEELALPLPHPISMSALAPAALTAAAAPTATTNATYVSPRHLERMLVAPYQLPGSSDAAAAAVVPGCDEDEDAGEQAQLGRGAVLPAVCIKQVAGRKARTVKRGATSLSTAVQDLLIHPGEDQSEGDGCEEEDNGDSDDDEASDGRGSGGGSKQRRARSAAKAGYPAAALAKRPAPRQGEGEGGQRRDMPALSLESLHKVFQLPLKSAALRLHVSVSHLKNTSRRLGVSGWPHRKFQSLHSLQQAVRADAALAPDHKQVVLAKIDRAREALFTDPRGSIPHDLDVMRKAVYKQRHAIAHKQ